MRAVRSDTYHCSVLAVTYEERRSGLRLSLPYAARLWGRDDAGLAFKEDTVVENLSTSGLFLRLTREVPMGTHVHVAALLLHESDSLRPGLRLAASGVVVRTEPNAHGFWGVAVMFIRRRVF